MKANWIRTVLMFLFLLLTACLRADSPVATDLPPDPATATTALETPGNTDLSAAATQTTRSATSASAAQTGLATDAAKIAADAVGLAPTLASGETALSSGTAVAVATGSTATLPARETAVGSFGIPGFPAIPGLTEPFAGTEADNIASGTAEEGWTLEDCLLWGLMHHPTLDAADADIQAAKARIDQQRASLRTKATIRAGFTRRRQEYSRASGRSIGGTDDLVDSTSEGLQVRQTISDWGQTDAQLAASRALLAVARTGRSWEVVTLLSSIKAAYFQVHQRRMLVDVRRESLQRFEDHLVRVRGFVDVGSKPPFDITKAQVDVANAKVELIKAERDHQDALARLVQTVGIEGSLPVALPGALLPPQLPDLDGNIIIKEAMTRADMLAAQYRVEAARYSLREAKKGMQPTLSGTVDYSWSGTVTPLERSWSAGLDLSVPVLDGYQTRSRVTSARSERKSVEARLVNARLALQREVVTAITGILEASQRLDATEVLVRQASESLELAQGRYESGFGSQIELTDSQAAFTSAIGNYVVAYFDTLIALNELDRVLGRIPRELIALCSPQQESKQVPTP